MLGELPASCITTAELEMHAAPAAAVTAGCLRRRSGSMDVTTK
jgi:hypothetical protein